MQTIAAIEVAVGRLPLDRVTAELLDRCSGDDLYVAFRPRPGEDDLRAMLCAEMLLERCH